MEISDLLLKNEAGREERIYPDGTIEVYRGGRYLQNLQAATNLVERGETYSPFQYSWFIERDPLKVAWFRELQKKLAECGLRLCDRGREPWGNDPMDYFSIKDDTEVTVLEMGLCSVQNYVSFLKFNHDASGNVQSLNQDIDFIDFLRKKINKLEVPP